MQGQKLVRTEYGNIGCYRHHRTYCIDFLWRRRHWLDSASNGLYLRKTVRRLPDYFRVPVLRHCLRTTAFRNDSLNLGYKKT